MKTLFDIRHEFLRFFERKGHKLVSSGSLIPHNDPSLMFTNAGMVQFKDTFLGKEGREYKRATTSQKCVRAGGKHNDLENVGYTKRHLTFFEMLGNFSFGDYFKEEAIVYAWDFVANHLKLNRDKLYMTVYHDDKEAFKLWKKVTGFGDDRIIKIKTKDNFWSMGDTGPCGPCAEVFYDQGSKLQGGLPGTKDQDGDRYVEIWNIVFMQYEQMANGKMVELANRAIDTGMGLERTAAVMQGVSDVFEVDLFKTLIGAVQELTKVKASGEHSVSHRIIADHLRTSSFLVSEGITPSNEGRGYVLRRIMRRAVRHIHKLGYKDLLMHKLVPTLIDEMGLVYPELVKQREFIESILKEEEESFKTTIGSGLNLLEAELDKLSSSKKFPGEIAFKLHDTYGFPVDLTTDILKERNMSIDMEAFNRSMSEQKERARKAWTGSGEEVIEEIWFDIKEQVGQVEFVGYENLTAKGEVQIIIQEGKSCDTIDNDKEFFLVTNQTPFFGESGGQAGDIGYIRQGKELEIEVLDTIIPAQYLHVHRCKLSKGKISIKDVVELHVDKEHRDNVKRNHTATHLVHALLRKKLGSSVVQKGSSVRPDRFRFDFSYSKAVPKELLDEVEREINDLILLDLEVHARVMSYSESLKTGATALFGEKYSDDVRVIYVGDEKSDDGHSIELCKGTHIDRLGEIGVLKILSETAIASGVRRIEAMTGKFAFRCLQENFNELKAVTSLIQADEGKVLERVQGILHDQKKLTKEVDTLKQKAFKYSLEKFKPEEIGNIKLIVAHVEKISILEIRPGVQQFLSENKSSVVLLFQVRDGALIYMVGVTSDLHKTIGADTICKTIVKDFNAKGGGNKLLAQGSLIGKEGLEKKIKERVKRLI